MYRVMSEQKLTDKSTTCSVQSSGALAPLVNKPERAGSPYSVGLPTIANQILTITEIQADSWKYINVTYVVISDFKQTYDELRRIEWFKISEDLEIDGVRRDTGDGDYFPWGYI